MKILIVRFSSIGDIVLTSPVIRCLKEQLPNAAIHYLTKESFRALPASYPEIDKVYSIRKDIHEVVGSLRKEQYDFIVDLHHNLRSTRLKAALRKRSGTFPKLNLEKWLAVNLKWNKLPSVHVVDRYFYAVTSLGVKNDGKGLYFPIPKDQEVSISSLPAGFQKGYTAVVIGAKHATKQLPVESLGKLIQSIKRPVVLLGGTEDKSKALQILSQLSNETSSRVYNACGLYSIHQSASLIKQAANVLTHDTGLMHIAAALNKEIVAVWGNTIPEFGMYPYFGNRSIRNLQAEVPGLSCRPCSKLGYPACPKKHFRCMKDQDLKKILGFLE